MGTVLEGTAYAGPPPNWVFPDVITINSTDDYSSPNTSALSYRSNDGRVLDFKTFNLNQSL